MARWHSKTWDTLAYIYAKQVTIIQRQIRAFIYVKITYVGWLSPFCATRATLSYDTYCEVVVANVDPIARADADTLVWL